MTKILVSAALVLSLATTAVQAGLETSLTKTCTVPAISATTTTEIKKKDKEPQLDEKTHKVYKKAHDAIEAKDFATAIAVLAPLDEKPPRKDYDKAVVQNLLGFAYAQSDDYVNAAKHLEQALALKVLPADQQAGGRQNLISFYHEADNNDAVLLAVDQYFAEVPAPRLDIYLVKAQTLMQMDRDAEAICPVYFALKLHPEPKPEWFRMLADLHGQLDLHDDAILVQQELIARVPGDTDQVIHLANLYLRADRNDEAFKMLADAEQKGLLAKDKDVKNLAALYWNNNEYQKSAETLEHGISRGVLKANEAVWKSIAQGWKQVGNNEKTLFAYGEAGKLASSGEVFLFQGEKLAELKQWEKAIAAYKTAIEKAGLGKNEGHTWLVLGYAQFRTSDFKNAMKSLEKAATYPEKKKEAQGIMLQVKAQM